MPVRFQTGVSLFWFPMYLFYMIPESKREDMAQMTCERRERAQNHPQRENVMRAL